MPRFTSRLVAAALLLLSCIAAPKSYAQAREESRLLVATQVLSELRGQRDDSIPDRLLQRAYGIAVIPDVTKVAFVLGGRRGNGLLVVRDASGKFNNPVFVSITGGGVGWQIGVQSTDIVLVFTTRRGVEGLAGGQLTLGAGASVAAGPVGRQGEAAAGLDAEVFSYSRNRGLFAGVSLDGTALSIDKGANARFYERSGVLASEIMSGAVTRDNPNLQSFMAEIARSTSGASASGATPTPAPTKNPAAAAPAPAVPAPAAPTGGARSFPAEDTRPGQEPK
jgi:lipid-binding SYLF domain-containing protein